MMKQAPILLLALACMSHGAQVSPIEKIIEMMSELQVKIIAEGDVAQKAYAEFAEWCEDESKNLHFEIKTSKAELEDLKAVIEKAAADIGAADAQIEEHSATIAADEADLKAATAIRAKEQADFAAEEKDLTDTVDTLERASSILEREMKGGASFVQMQNAGNLVHALQLLVTSAQISSGDASKLTALIQDQQSDSDSDGEDSLGAPDPAVYESKSGGIIDTINDMLDKAEATLAEARKVETKSAHNYDLLKLQLEDAIKFANKQLDKAKKNKAKASETKATAEGDLEVTEKDLAEDVARLGEIHHDCMTKATDFELSTADRGDELKAIATAKKIIVETTGGAASQSYDLAQVSLLQVASQSKMASANYKAVKFVRNLSRQLNSGSLMQLADRMAAAGRMNDDVFAKVKGLIGEMIERLVSEAEAEAKEKAYCDKEMGETKAKREDLGDSIDDLTTKIDKMSAESAKLKEEVALLSKELADLAKSQAEMDKLRLEEKEAYDANKAEMEQGVEGIKMALKVLRDYYAKDKEAASFVETAHTKADGAAGGIIGLLEVCESDFSKGLSDMISEEESAVALYKQTTKENEIAKVTKTQDVKYKSAEAKSLDKAAAEASADREGLQTELDAVNEYWEKIKERCVAKPEPYEERKKRREAEIAGLKEALEILEQESSDDEALVQKAATHKHIRGARF